MQAKTINTNQLILNGFIIFLLKIMYNFTYHQLFMWKILSFFILLSSATQSQNAYKPQIVSATRSEIVLNGVWDIQPTIDQDNSISEDQWGKIRVPGAWYQKAWWANIPGIIQKGVGSNWQHNTSDLNKVWYKTKVVIPTSWENKIVEINVDRVSTDAVIYVNGNMAGVIEWASGTVDITAFVKWGEANEIRILNIATPNEGEIANLMGTITEQLTFTKASLTTKGITGNVSLTSRLRNAHISDVFVITSVRKQEIAAEIEILDLKIKGNCLIVSNVLDDKQNIVKSFRQNVSSKGNDTQTFEISTTWVNPEMWDLDKPNMYTLKTSLFINGKLQDEYVQTFGFREFWIEGKNFYLNGKRINLRPTLDPPGDGMNELSQAGLLGIRNAGYNFLELWPNNNDIRGDYRTWNNLIHAADKQGFLLSGVVIPFTFYIVDNSFSYTWDNPGFKEKWISRMTTELRRQRNHPSVILWGTAANFFGNEQDQNPLNIGQKDWIVGNDFWQRTANAANEAISIIKQKDPTRAVFTHHGAYVGDINTVNNYLCLTPLQEREEWLSTYATTGKMPFMAIEFGTPFYCTFLRGRNGYGNSLQSEPLATEFCAMYFGPDAFASETKEYRQMIKKNFITAQKYKSLGNPLEMEQLPAFQALECLFVKNTWRSWRTYEVSGGMIPWNMGHGWTSINADKKVKMPTFESGRKGTYFEEVPLRKLKYLQPDAWQMLPAAKSMKANNNEVLAYIANGGENFAAKDHHFKQGESIYKKFFFFNDTRMPQKCVWNASISVGGVILKKDAGILELPVGEKRSQDFMYLFQNLPKKWKQEGQIILKATINEIHLTDTFNFRVFETIENITKEVYVFDPEGKTTKALKTLNYTVRNWDGKQKIPFLVLGRNALLSKYSPNFQLQRYVAEGGKVLIMNQHPDSVTKKRGFRTSPFLSRYVFPINEHHPLIQGLDALDFRNWTGQSTLTEAYPDYMKTNYRKGSGTPYYGWQWGNQGAVSTGAIEKPHRSGWKPLLECEFDMAWTPLMELNYGKGLVLWNAMDLEDHFEQDVVAETMFNRLIDYMDSVKPQTRSKNTILLGNLNDVALLDDMGLVYERSNKMTSKTDLLIVGNITENQEKAVKKFVKSGGKALVLPRTNGEEILGVQYTYDSLYNGAYHIPNWKVSEGLSVSDTRFRTHIGTWIIAEGCDSIGVDGLLGIKKWGKGEMVFTQFDPNRFNADSLTYFRFTRWRQTRALSQIAANLGATFTMDDAVFKIQAKAIDFVSLDGNWKAAMTLPLPAVKDPKDKYKDPGITDQALAYMQEQADESRMIEIKSNLEFEKANADWAALDGEMVYRKTIHIPKEMVGKELQLNLDLLDDFDQVYLNGVLVGKTGIEMEPVWSYVRVYQVPANIAKEGKNTLAIRIFDTFGGGGIVPSSKKRELVVKNRIKKHGLYHADYIDDYQMGDDPFRYFRW